MKVDYFGSPIAATVEAVEADGLWCQSRQIMDQAVQARHLQSKNLEGTSMFVPASRIEYLLVLRPADKPH
jgi:hypothetical protein